MNKYQVEGGAKRWKCEECGKRFHAYLGLQEHECKPKKITT